jgi:hypothetical protein
MGVKNYKEVGTGTGKLENHKPGNQGPSSGSGFWHQVKTGKPESGAYIFFNILYILIYILLLFFILGLG